MMKNKYHFIGIGGIGMSALAQMLLRKNIQVTGSDVSQNYMTDFLAEKGAEIFIGHAGSQVSKGSTVIYSSDIPLKNPEYKAALDLECKILHRSDLLSDLMKDYKTLAVTGTHGKTTTTSLLAKTLFTGKFDPSFAIGGIAVDFNTNGAANAGDYFVAEADESDGTFLKYTPFGAIVTNIDNDHMNHFKTKEHLIASFKKFFENVLSKEHLFYCGDDQNLLEMQCVGVSYGFSDHNDLRLKNYRQAGWNSFFTIEFKDKVYQNIELNLVGKHNALNAAAVFGLSLTLGVDEHAIREAFKTFQGVLRRCEKKAEISGVLILDDYAHHPTEIKATLKAVRSAILEKRLIAIYQPHRYSRIKEILGTFGNCFDEASELIITDIYAAGEEKAEGLSYQNILDELKELKIPVHYIPREQLAKELQQDLLPHDVVVSLGAGDITRLSNEILEICKTHPIKKIKAGIIFGGRSEEHEISIRSVRHVAASLNPAIYEPYFFAISKEGVWQFGAEFLDYDTINSKEVVSMSPEILKKIQECDVLFPVLHGPFGEDGTIQGFFEMIDKPYVGCGARSSSICMDKVVTKNIMIVNDIATSPFIAFTHHEWKHHPDKIIHAIYEKLTFPVFVKPSHLGSAIGVTKVVNREGLLPAIELSFKYDKDILVENGIEGREIEFAVLGNDEVTVFPPGEICTKGKVYSYEAKYLSDDMKTSCQADLPSDLVEEGMCLAKKAYLATGCQGMARVDFFLDKMGKYWLNEINPIPGFTNISLYPAICAAHGLKGEALIDRLIQLAFEKRRTQKKYS